MMTLLWMTLLVAAFVNGLAEQLPRLAWLQPNTLTLHLTMVCALLLLTFAQDLMNAVDGWVILGHAYRIVEVGVCSWCVLPGVLALVMGWVEEARGNTKQNTVPVTGQG
ncbi:hypothetical protein [Deinococcus hopiensis]|uniref:Uncharacterized protein n=1 Tax=Deinococcus hopiensis KR-140 TaxID=695939 RepID=A0A1W1UA72_9DEIO|nr:hypothetical protein [Deinococcus hopiensis]SMB77943.1 hypothetical protein SAMN00790413_04019 [Deinococcus hopiensis KR-140]